MKPIEIGSRVMMARAFLRSIGVCTGDLCFQQGTVSRISGDVDRPGAYATVQWDHGGTSASLIKNLVRVDQRHLEPV